MQDFKLHLSQAFKDNNLDTKILDSYENVIDSPNYEKKEKLMALGQEESQVSEMSVQSNDAKSCHSEKFD